LDKRKTLIYPTGFSLQVCVDTVLNIFQVQVFDDPLGGSSMIHREIQSEEFCA
jgi:hypothetical protein